MVPSRQGKNIINQVECSPVLEYDEGKSFLSISNMDAFGDIDNGILVEF